MGKPAGTETGPPPARSPFLEAELEKNRHGVLNVKPGQPVAFYPGPADPGAALSSAMVATVIEVHPDGSCDLLVEGVPVEGVSRLARGQHATPHTWSP